MPRRLIAPLLLAVLPLLAGCGLLSVPAATGSGPLPAVARTPTAIPTDATLPPGTPVAAGRWSWIVGPVLWDRTPSILAANPHAPSVPDGYGWAVVHLTATNVSTERASPSIFDATLAAAGWTVSSHQIAETPVRLPDAFTSKTVGPGESVTGDIGFWVPLHAQTDRFCSVTLDVRPRVTAESEEFVFACSVDPGSAATDAPPPATSTPTPATTPTRTTKPTATPLASPTAPPTPVPTPGATAGG
ncbi:hypothetical protein ACO03V_00650 [Microbacterium sp. HMH0099]|uniref:hypothetical protein n=1 Tax=Microbacterium sp. HMH0099 TaxID=3414026 RepID=UPI003BF646B7